MAGLGPDARLLRYAKSHVHALWATPLPFLPEGALLLSGTLGAMLPWGPGWYRRPTTISDRFWLGGVGTVRGFRVRGLGPTAVRRVDPDEVRAARGHTVEARQSLMPCCKLTGTAQWFCDEAPRADCWAASELRRSASCRRNLELEWRDCLAGWCL